MSGAAAVQPVPAADPTLVLKATDLQRHYSVSRGFLQGHAILKAVAGVSFALRSGQTLAVVGESGCGKSTLARLVTMIEPPTSGALEIEGKAITAANPAVAAELRARVQMVFQDPYGSLNPRKQVGQILEEPLEINTRLDRAARAEAAPRVGISSRRRGCVRSSRRTCRRSS